MNIVYATVRESAQMVLFIFETFYCKIIPVETHDALLKMQKL